MDILAYNCWAGTIGIICCIAYAVTLNGKFSKLTKTHYLLVQASAFTALGASVNNTQKIDIELIFTIAHCFHQWFSKTVKTNQIHIGGQFPVICFYHWKWKTLLFLMFAIFNFFVFKPTDYCLSASVSDASVHLSMYVSMYFLFLTLSDLRLERLSNKAIKQ